MSLQHGCTIRLVWEKRNTFMHALMLGNLTVAEIEVRGIPRKLSYRVYYSWNPQIDAPRDYKTLRAAKRRIAAELEEVGR